MAIQLEKLNVEELYQKVRGEVGEETADAIKREHISGDILASLTDDELKELLPKLGPRKQLQIFKDSFKPKVCWFAFVLTLTYGECEKFLSYNITYRCPQLHLLLDCVKHCTHILVYAPWCIHSGVQCCSFKLSGYKLIYIFLPQSLQHVHTYKCSSQENISVSVCLLN